MAAEFVDFRMREPADRFFKELDEAELTEIIVRLDAVPERGKVQADNLKSLVTQ